MDFRNVKMKMAKYNKQCGSCSRKVALKGERCVDCTEWGKCEFSGDLVKMAHIDQGWDEEYIKDKYGA